MLSASSASVAKWTLWPPVTVPTTGKPSAEELALLEPFKASLPPEVFDEPYRPPVSDGSGKDRKLLQAADKLLNEAGWTVKNGVRVNPKGEAFDLEFLIVDPTSERVLSNYVENLKRLGFAISIRRVDPAQYQRRVKSFDFDVVTARYSLRLTPGVELRSYWASETASMDGSLNLAGISNPVIDTLIGKVVASKSRAELELAARALDRVLALATTGCPNGTNRSTILPIGTGFPVRP